MIPEFIQTAERIIDKFGFPVFVALVALVFFWQMFVYFKAAIQKKDCEFIEHVRTSTRAMADYVAHRDKQMSEIISNHNEAFRENSHALTRLSDSIERRILQQQQEAGENGNLHPP